MLAVELIENINKEDLGPITVIAGEDTGQYAYMKEVILKRLSYDPADLSNSYFDLSETDFQVVEDDLESLPFFSDEKIIFLDHMLDITTTNKHFLDEKELKRFESYLSNPSSTNKLIIFAEGKLDGKRRIVKLLKRDAQLFEATNLKESELKTYFQKLAHKVGLTFERGVFEALIDKSNFDFNELRKNISFLRTYKEDGVITLEDIQEAIPKTLQDNVFDLMQLVLSKNVDEARQLIRDLSLQGEDEIKLIAIMISQIRMFLQVKLLASKGMAEGQIRTELSNMLGRNVSPYQVKYSLRDSRTLSLGFLSHLLKVLIETDYQIKTGTYEKDYLFELAILKMISGEYN